MRRVGLARRTLFADRRRLAASVLGVGAALMLILLLEGLWAGIQAQVTLYEDNVGAELYVVAPGTLNLFADGSNIPLTTVDRVRATSGVDWVAPVRATYSIVDLQGRKEPVAMIGSVPNQHGGVWNLASGRAPQADNEIVIDRVLANRHDLAVGSTITVEGVPLRIVGISRDTAMFMTSLVFVTHHAMDTALRTPNATSAVLVGTADPSAVASRLSASGLTVVTRQRLHDADLALATNIYGKPLKLMVGVGVLAGTLVIALTAYTLVTEQRRAYGVIKALGASGGRLTALAVEQTFALAAIGAAASLVLFFAGRALIEWLRPQFLVLLTGDTILIAGAAAFVMALLAAMVPARRLNKLDAASAFRSTT
jgi:putative ABC transport system permease protein